jgi:hypothetical protein
MPVRAELRDRRRIQNRAPEVLLHLACHVVGLPGAYQREQPTARAEDDAIRGWPDRDHQVRDVPACISERHGQDRVPGHIG